MGFFISQFGSGIIESALSLKLLVLEMERKKEKKTEQNTVFPCLCGAKYLLQVLKKGKKVRKTECLRDVSFLG